MRIILLLTTLFTFSVFACSKNDFVENTLTLKEIIPKLKYLEYSYEESVVFTGAVKSENVLGNMIYLNYIPERSEPGVFILAFDIGEETFYLYHFNLGSGIPLKPTEGKWASCNKILFRDDSNERFYSVLEFNEANKMTLGSFESGKSQPFLSYDFY